MYKKCTHCGRYYNPQKDDKMCKECKKHYEITFDKIMKRRKIQLGNIYPINKEPLQ